MTEPSIQSRLYMLKTKILVIICVGISVGFLLGMGVSALLRAMIAGGDRGLEMTFTALVTFMAGILVTYGLKSIPDNQLTVAPENEINSTSTPTPAIEVEETAPLPSAVVGTTLLNGTQKHPEARVNGKHTPVVAVPAGVEPIAD
ncbi:MAG: hypothetical protein CMJ45_01720 [Planctomyces sp.]|nr:hypothetical protein [Planctomyces sp.]